MGLADSIELVCCVECGAVDLVFAVGAACWRATEVAGVGQDGVNDELARVISAKLESDVTVFCDGKVTGDLLTLAVALLIQERLQEADIGCAGFGACLQVQAAVCCQQRLRAGKSAV